ncbi:hypothetical protein F4806DRAFT_461289 [Annulohypoxylon nitens]|nr:hypothetical protein F4806DRAFT_461289 [Annulohypoxylon nitens]
MPACCVLRAACLLESGWGVGNFQGSEISKVPAWYQNPGHLLYIKFVRMAILTCGFLWRPIRLDLNPASPVNSS